MIEHEAPESLVVGATGFVGRWVVRELLIRGGPVAATVRGGRDEWLRRWLRDHGADDTGLTTVSADIGRPGLGLSVADGESLARVRDVFNAAALYRFGMPVDEARAVNVTGAVNVLDRAASLPRLRRLVHVSGYRVGREPFPGFPLPTAASRDLYRRLGAYEASKVEGDTAVRLLAGDRGVPVTMVCPATVIGHSATGEAGQYIGPSMLVERLWRGRLAVLPGSPRTFLPVVTVDHLAAFIAAVPEYDEGPLRSHTVLDGATPPLPEMMSLIADHLGVRRPRVTVPVSLVRRLPRALTGVDPEGLSFLSEDRYDTASADRLARAAGLAHPPVEEALRRWASRLVAEDFGHGAAAPGSPPR
ncbi:SDR family oxidoreductase [Nocardiopsis lambiniae]|uniref:SDR family oxidoreductase n=1 Tax=Nocardiopsis lambiniae TaxID=3075539 RepID=A0ABU2M8L5_9ACTN|nr:SDR family oxidoreductase [Nocardiopsis sp. DSM 44743]MDT0329014.1 SDR family oxidoreductase [Nocardiopsis sp. DSM 44743]